MRRREKGDRVSMSGRKMFRSPAVTNLPRIYLGSGLGRLGMLSDLLHASPQLAIGDAVPCPWWHAVLLHADDLYHAARVASVGSSSGISEDTEAAHSLLRCIQA